jgi:hypothetical protein
MGKHIRIPEDDFTFWLDGHGTPRYRGTTSAEAPQKVAEVAEMAEQWLQLQRDPPKKLTAPIGSSTMFHVSENAGKFSAALGKPSRMSGQIFERRKLHPTHPTNPGSTQPSKSKSAPPMIKCETCPSEVRSDRMHRHLRKECPGRHSVDPSRTTSSPTTQPASRSESSTRASVSVNRGENGSNRVHPPESHYESREARRLDGSRDYWLYREEGRFGSYPSFDACDDESAP